MAGDTSLSRRHRPRNDGFGSRRGLNSSGVWHHARSFLGLHLKCLRDSRSARLLFPIGRNSALFSVSRRRPRHGAHVHRRQDAGGPVDTHSDGNFSRSRWEYHRGIHRKLRHGSGIAKTSRCGSSTPRPRQRSSSANSRRRIPSGGPGSGNSCGDRATFFQIWDGTDAELVR